MLSVKARLSDEYRGNISLGEDLQVDILENRKKLAATCLPKELHNEKKRYCLLISCCM